MSAQAAAAKHSDRARGGEFLRFCVVGGVGFTVDAGVLLVAVHFGGMDPIAGRILSFAIAVWSTFELNRRWAFRNRGSQNRWGAFARYLGVQGLGFVCNLTLYTLLYLTLPSPYGAPLPCLAIASGATLLVNYVGTRLLVFRPR